MWRMRGHMLAQTLSAHKSEMKLSEIPLTSWLAPITKGNFGGLVRLHASGDLFATRSVNESGMPELSHGPIASEILA